jgi:hypothetical protein
MNEADILCPISQIPMKFAFQETVLGRLKVRYFSCPACGLLKTEAPYWLEEAYREPIAAGDTGLVARNIGHSRFLKTFLALNFPVDAQFVDLAGGYGLLTRLLRDQGFDCFSTDPHCPNIFASTFEPHASCNADALFAFEVLEHIYNPLEFIEQQFERFNCRTLVFSTLTFQSSNPPQDWWYYAFDTGQHITFYQPRSLEHLATRLRCRYYQVNPGLHVFSDTHLSLATRFAVKNKWARKLLSLYTRGKMKGRSLTWRDHLSIKAPHIP